MPSVTIRAIRLDDADALLKIFNKLDRESGVPGGFIGSHLVKRLKREGLFVRGVDLKYPSFSELEADDFIVGDLRDLGTAQDAVDGRFDEIYQLAADMGGAGYIFTGGERRRRHAQFGADQSQYARGVSPPRLQADLL